MHLYLRGTLQSFFMLRYHPQRQGVEGSKEDTGIKNSMISWQWVHLWIKLLQYRNGADVILSAFDNGLSMVLLVEGTSSSSAWQCWGDAGCCTVFMDSLGT